MIISHFPVWILFIAAALLVMVSIEAGHRLGKSAHQRSEEEKESPVSAMAGAMLGLTAFILAFTFNIVSNRYDQRLELVREDTSAIRTAYLRSDFFPNEQERIDAKKLFKEYLDLRLEFSKAMSLEKEAIDNLMTRSQQIQTRLWDMAVVNARRDMDSDVAALYIESLNEVSRINGLRIALGLQLRLPNPIWLILCSMTILAMVGVGYQTGIAGSKRTLAGPILAISFALEIGRAHV